MPKLSGIINKISFKTSSGVKNGTVSSAYLVDVIFDEGSITWESLIKNFEPEVKRVHARKVGREWTTEQFRRSIVDGRMTIKWSELVGPSSAVKGPDSWAILTKMWETLGTAMTRDQYAAMSDSYDMGEDVFLMWWEEMTGEDSSPDEDLTGPWFDRCMNATELRTEFARLSKKFHPDSNGNGTEFEELMKKISAEYTESKKQYSVA